MLTEAEKKWLGNREFANAVDYGAYSCPSCWWLNKELEECILRRCLRFDPDYQDAAEFEARVAAKLSRMDWEDVPCAHGMSLFCPKKGGPHINCGAWCLMREARLAVEAEMEQLR